VFCRRFKKWRVIKVFRVKDKKDVKDLCSYKVYAYLFDTYSASSAGGTGRTFNWALLKGLKTSRPVFISGGLNPGNVARVVQALNPQWVDACSGLESHPGRKDYRKVRQFLKAAKG
jgi:phosphoribosylanthranilate isomerase